MDEQTFNLKKELRKAGLSDQAVDAAWPHWWSEAASKSSSARAELRFTLARRLGLSPQSLSDDRVEFVWKDNTRFKHLSKEDEFQQAALSSFGIAIGRSLIRGTMASRDLLGVPPDILRSAILNNRPFVDLAGLLAICWGLGIPVIHLRVFPLSSKGMHAMVVKVGDRYAVLLGRDAQYPAPIAFTLAHEIAHVALGHLEAVSAVIDMEDPADANEADVQERQADEFALQLLTGEVHPDIQTNIENFGARQLAASVIEVGNSRGIEPGTLALCLAYRSQKWPVANAALKHIYDVGKPVWREVNLLARRELDWDALGEDARDYLHAVMAIADE